MKLVAPLAVAFTFAVASCREPSSDGRGTSPSTVVSAPPGTEWAQVGSNDERFARLAKQLRGFDVAMVEVGYRYNALYWAGRDQNWDFAQYQLEKIRTAIANGVERRPKRAPSARMLEGPLAALDKATEGKDAPGFATAFDTLTGTCNACHQAERVAFITVAKPTIRITPVQPVAPPP